MPVPPAGNLTSTTSANAALASGRGLTAGSQPGVASGGGVRGRGEAAPAQQSGVEPSRAIESSAQVDLSPAGRVRASIAEVRDVARAVQPANAADPAPLRSNETLRADASRLVGAINIAVRVSAEAAPAGGQSFGQAPVQGRASDPVQNTSSTPSTSPDLPLSSQTGQQPTPTAATDRPATPRQATNAPRNDAAVPSPARLNDAPAGATVSRPDVEPPASASDAFNETQALNRIGISVGREGAVSFDTARFDNVVSTDRAAVEQTLSRFGQRVEASAERQLSSVENPERPEPLILARVDRADHRAARIEEVQVSVQQRIEFQQQVNQTNNPFLVGGVAAYRGVFAL